MNEPEEKLRNLGIELPPPVQPVANYVTFVQVGNLLFLSGHGYCGTPTAVDIGKLGRDLTVEQGYQAARNAGVCVLATIQHALFTLSKVKRIVRVLGMVNATEDFADHPKVINGFSDLMVEVFGEKGKHVRSAVGMGSLPGGIAVEIEVTLEVEE
ncbi:RidA family protein [Pontibacter pamirensis]|uniref:RidA family protein n=1 Tax=Pontibacter pamirensis TaxID=2562824 RepID=UPI001389A502|nr:RidA family protein [Pontibacter pamirensis]